MRAKINLANGFWEKAYLNLAKKDPLPDFSVYAKQVEKVVAAKKAKAAEAARTPKKPSQATGSSNTGVKK